MSGSAFRGISYMGHFVSAIAGSAMSAKPVSVVVPTGGECAQFCRLPFSLVDADGKVIVKDKHLLSLKDMNQSDELEQLLDAGGFLVQDRRATERRFLREECNGSLSSKIGMPSLPVVRNM